MDIIKRYFKNRHGLSVATAENGIIDLEKRLGTTFPDDYKSFLTHVNGFEGEIGESYVRLNSVDEVEGYTLDYCSEFYPDKICIGTNGGGEIFLIDKVQENRKYGIVPAIGDMNDYVELGNTFEKFIGRISKGILLK